MNKNYFESVNRKNTSSYKWDASEKIINRSDVIPFWIADSDYETCPEVKKAILERASSAAFGYTFASKHYFEVLSNWCNKHYGYKINEENTVLTTGVVNALYFLVKLFTSEADKVLVNPPVYNPFYDVIKNNKRIIYKSALIRKEINDYEFTYEFDFNDLEEKIKDSKMYILCNPHNPVGRCYTYNELQKIVSLCKKYNCILVADEIHCDLMINDSTFTSVGTFFKDYENIVLCTAPSKTFNVAGLASSNIFFNNLKMHKIFSEEYHNMSIECNIFGLTATEAAYKFGEYWVKEQNEFLSKQANLVYDFVKRNNLKCAKLEATYLMWIDMSRFNLSQDDLINGLLDHHVWVNSGINYEEKAIGFIRLNIACSKEQLIEGLKQIEEFIQTLK